MLVTVGGSGPFSASSRARVAAPPLSSSRSSTQPAVPQARARLARRQRDHHRATAAASAVASLTPCGARAAIGGLPGLAQSGRPPPQRPRSAHQHGDTGQPRRAMARAIPSTSPRSGAVVACVAVGRVLYSARRLEEADAAAPPLVRAALLVSGTGRPHAAACSAVEALA